MLNASLDSLSFSSVPSNKFLRVNELGIPTISDIKSCPLLPAYYGETYIRGKWRIKLFPNMYFKEQTSVPHCVIILAACVSVEAHETYSAPD